MTGISMFDSIFNNQFPANPQAVAGYVDGGEGDQPNAASLARAFPNAHHLSIALFAENNADALDVEPGAATPADIPGWFARQRARGIGRPVLYANASTMEASVIPVVRALPGGRPSVRLWGAHYTGEAHICGPGSCGETSIDLDGTQWTSNAMGRTLDQSLLLENFFGNTPPVNWTEQMLDAIPVISQGSTGPIVRTIQADCCARANVVPAAQTTIDGSFGPKTTAAVKAVQAHYLGAAQADGKVGPKTWPALMGLIA